MSTPSTPQISRVRKLPLVWIVPLLALAVGGWMVFRELWDRGPEITIEFANGSGVVAGKTTLDHKGVTVGAVIGVDLKKDLSGVVVRVRLDKSAAVLATTAAQFWIVNPEIGFSGIHGLETLLTGARINVRPGQGAPATHFVGLEKIPAAENVRSGRAFILQSDRLGSLSSGAPVFYREVKVGTVETSRLSEDATSVLIRIRVERRYADLVRTTTRFWNAGGANFKVSLLGAQLKSTSLESLFTGGVAFATPDTAPLALVAEDSTQFTLSAEADKDWFKWAPVIAIQPQDSAPEPARRDAGVPPVLKP